ncbi:MAG: hypothetical protein NC127_09140 [Muribaculum sp.]|nr:hypothetical protein [Muribaculum sp.]
MLRKKKTDGNTSEPTDAVNENRDTIIVSTEEPETVDETEKNNPDESNDSDKSDGLDGLDRSDGSDESDESEESDGSDKMADAFEAWLSDSSLDSVGIEATRAALEIVSGSISSGKFDDIFFDLIAKGADYDRAVEEAEIAGEVRGRNVKIDELRNAITDDGLPHPGAGGGGSIPNRAPSIFDLARDAY